MFKHTRARLITYGGRVFSHRPPALSNKPRERREVKLMGMIYQRGKVFWIKYYRAGKPYRESSKSEDEGKAKSLLKLREGEIVMGNFPGLQVQRVRFEELQGDLINDCKVNAKKSLGRLGRSLKHLADFIKGFRVIDITTDRINVYIFQRQEEGAENATINRELSALKRMLNLARRMTPPKVVNAPYVPHLQENGARQGYFEHNEYLALRKALPAYLKPVVSMAYHTGMRKEEILGLQWPQVDLMEGKISLRPEDTKNSESRAVFMSAIYKAPINLTKAQNGGGWRALNPAHCFLSALTLLFQSI